MVIEKGIFEKVAAKIGGVALPRKPGVLEGEYSFPEDPTILSAEEIGKWMFSLTAWNGYVLRNLALADLLASEIRNEYDRLMQESLSAVAWGKGKTRNQAVLEAHNLNPLVTDTKKKLDEATAESQTWERFHKIYEAQVAVLSREISRRMGEQRLEGRLPV